MIQNFRPKTLNFFLHSFSASSLNHSHPPTVNKIKIMSVISRPNLNRILGELLQNCGANVILMIGIHCNYANPCDSFCGCRVVTISMRQTFHSVRSRFHTYFPIEMGRTSLRSTPSERDWMEDGAMNANKRRRTPETMRTGVSLMPSHSVNKRAINNWNNLSLFVCVVLFCHLILFISACRVLLILSVSIRLSIAFFVLSFRLRPLWSCDSTHLHCLWSQWGFAIDFCFP